MTTVTKAKHQIIAEMISRECGATTMQMIAEARTTSPSKRVSEPRDLGWEITKTPVDGTNYHRFFGKAPAGRMGDVTQ